MLKEKITYKDELPINILVAEIEEYPIHFHDELEVVYILKGKVKLRNGYYSYELKQGDIFILNDREIHSFNRIDDEENLV
ncbi:MAG: AraC family ligand binding domain-containing protein, partial [Anaerovoracaceae bacterium]